MTSMFSFNEATKIFYTFNTKLKDFLSYIKKLIFSTPKFMN
jgi:hypothetical protein